MRDSLSSTLGLVIFALASFAPSLSTGSAWAADASAPPPGGVASTPNGDLVMSSQVCASLGTPAANGANVTASGNVPGADYQPGVDVDGNEVASADLPSSGSNPTIDNFPIEIDHRLAGRVHLPPGTGSKAVLGYVTVRNNQAYFNGQPLNGDQTAALAEACRQAHH